MDPCSNLDPDRTGCGLAVALSLSVVVRVAACWCPSWSVYLCGALPPAAGDRFRELAHTHMQMSGQREHTVGEKVTSLACSVYIVVVHDVHRVSSTAQH